MKASIGYPEEDFEVVRPYNYDNDDGNITLFIARPGRVNELSSTNSEACRELNIGFFSTI